MQYDTTINRWHTSKNTARINASNPCSEYMFLDDSACNLASFNLLKFLTPGGQFDIAAYRYAIAIVHHRDGDYRRRSGLSHGDDRAQLARLSPAGPGVRQPGRAADGLRPALRLRRRPRLRSDLTSILCGDAYWQSARIAENCAPLGAATSITQQTEIAAARALVFTSTANRSWT